MKTSILILFTLFLINNVVAQKPEITNIDIAAPADNGKKLNVTLIVNGYTIRIYGNATYNVLTGYFTFEGNVTVTGQGENTTLTVRYSGPLQKGSNNNKYHKELLPKQDAETIDWVISRLILQNGRKISFDSN